MQHDNEDNKNNVVNPPPDAPKTPEEQHKANESAAFDKRLNTLKHKHGLDEDLSKKAKATNDGVKAGIELLTPIVVCFFVGMGLDNWLDKSPLFLMIFFVLGVITGFWNIYKLTK